MTSKTIAESLEQLRMRQRQLVARNVRIVDGARPGKRGLRLMRVMVRTKPLRSLEEQLERNLRQAVNDEQWAAMQASHAG